MFITPDRRELKILGQTIDIIIDDEFCDKESADGLYQGHQIILRSRYESHSEYQRILRHEAFHALCDLLGCQLDHHLEETLAHRVSYMFTYEV